MIEPIHRQAVLKLINYFTRTPYDSPATSTSNNQSDANEVQLYRFKESSDYINIPAITRLGVIISKFDKFFRPSPLILNGSPSTSLKSPFNSVNILYLQQISDLVQYIEVNLFDNIPNIRNEPINVETSQVLQNSSPVHALIVIIKDWIQQFYVDESIIPSLFPALNNERTLFKLVEIKENNICVWAILIFNVLYKLRDSFPEFAHVLDFSWNFLFFATMENLLDMVRFDQNFISNLLQTSLLYARMEEEQERQIYATQYKQIETLRAKIIETKKRSQALAMGTITHQQVTAGNKAKLVNNGSNNLGELTSAVKIPTGATKNSSSGKAKSNKRGFLSNNPVTNNQHPHLTDKPYHCQSCNKTFPTSYKLNRHAYSHSGERPYQCSWPNCEKRFNDNYHLRRHTNTHTGDKPFPCKYAGCSKRYSRSEDLRNHQKTHYPANTGPVGVDPMIRQQHEQVDQNGGHQGTIITNTTTSSGPTPTTTNILQHLATTTNSDGSINLLVQQQQSPANLANNNNGNSSNSQQLSSNPNTATYHASLAPQPPPSQMTIKGDSTAATTADQVLVLNQLHMQLQQHHQQQQSNQQQSNNNNNNFSSLSPVISDETALQSATILLQESAASAAQNHVAGLHIADYNF